MTAASKLYQIMFVVVNAMEGKMSDRHSFIYNEFDIEAARNAGKISEQERIIKLLENLPIQVEFSDGIVDEVTWPADHLIALIKGEK